MYKVGSVGDNLEFWEGVLASSWIPSMALGMSDSYFSAERRKRCSACERLAYL